MFSDILTTAIAVAEVLGFGLICFWFGMYVATYNPTDRQSITDSVIPRAIEPVSVSNAIVGQAAPQCSDRLTLEQCDKMLTAQIELVWMNQQRWMQFALEQVWSESISSLAVEPVCNTSDVIQPIALLESTVKPAVKPAIVTIEAQVVEDTTEAFIRTASIRDLKAVAKALTDTDHKIKRYSRLKQPELVEAMLTGDRFAYLSTLNLPEIVKAHRTAAKSKGKPATTTIHSKQNQRNCSNRSK